MSRAGRAKAGSRTAGPGDKAGPAPAATTRTTARLALRVTPRSSRNEVVGWDGEGTLRVKIKAPPVEGEANAELIAWLAKLLGVRKSAVRIRQGESGRNKMVEIEGVTDAAVRAALK